MIEAMDGAANVHGFGIGRTMVPVKHLEGQL